MQKRTSEFGRGGQGMGGEKTGGGRPGGMRPIGGLLASQRLGSIYDVRERPV